MFERRSPSVVSKYYLYMAANGPGFIYPVYVLYLLAHGVTFAQLGIILAAQSAITVLGEVPTGYVGDRVGRRNSLALGQVLYVVSTVLLLVGETFPVFLLGFVTMALGRTFVSGSGSAWLYDILGERLDEGQYTHVRGRGKAIEKYATAGTMITGGVLYVVGPLLPFVALLVSRLVTLGAVVWLPKNRQYADESSDAKTGDTGTGDAGTGDAILRTMREELTAPAVRRFVAYMTVVFGTAVAVDPFVQPIAVDTLEATVGGTLRSLGVAEAATLGVLYASFTTVSGLLSDQADAVQNRLGTRLAIVAVPAVVAALMVLPTVVPVLALPMFFAVKGSNALLSPIAERYLNDQIASTGRASVLSAASMAYSLGRIPFAVGAGVVADLFSPLAAVAALGGLLVVAGGGLLVVLPPVGGSTTETAGPAASD